MKALSLWQPWATYIAIGAKRFETRSWATQYRGPLAIHAAKHPMGNDERWLLSEHRLPFGSAIPFGAIVATCELVDCLRMTEAMIDKLDTRELDLGNWEVGRFAWCLVNVVALSVPLPFRGAQSLFDVPDELLRVA